MNLFQGQNAYTGDLNKAQGLVYSGDLVMSITGDKIDSGKLVQLAERSIEELKRGIDERVRVVSPQAKELERKLAEAGFEVSEEDNALLVAGASSAQVGELAAKSSLVLHELTPLAAQLEDVFFELTSGEPK